MLDCNFSLSGELPELRVTVRDLARIEVGTVLTLSAPAGSPGQLTLEGKTFYAGAPVGQGNHKAMQLLKALHLGEDEDEGSED
jgi:flagellar motor switch protein FliM